MRELTVEHHLMDVCKARGAACYKSELICAGFPDRMVIAPRNRITLVETKAPAGVVSPIQRLIHRRLRRLGVVVAVLWSKQEVDRWAEDFFV